MAIDETAVLMSNVGDIVTSVIMLILGLLLVVGICFGAYFAIKRHRQYNQFKCVVWGRDAFGQLTEQIDKAGIFVDSKTKNKRFFMKSANVGLNPDNVPYIQQGNKKVVYLLRTGLKNFQFIKPVITSGGFTVDVGEEDVNWAVNAYERQKKTFGQSMLMQFLPFIVLAFVSIIILIIFINLFKKLDVLKDVAVAFKDATVAMAQAQSGTVVLT